MVNVSVLIMNASTSSRTTFVLIACLKLAAIILFFLMIQLLPISSPMIFHYVHIDGQTVVDLMTCQSQKKLSRL